MRLAFWALVICIWLASAILSWQVASTLFMFGALDIPNLQIRLMLWAPVAALVALAAVAMFRRKAVWLPAVLLLSPVLQVASLLLANLTR